MIELLPIHIANQIAAGEVVQRGASIVKELLENAIDSGASRIVLSVRDGGRNLVQVVDNGCGMSPDDASRAFLRHATSKIRTAEDLFALRTFGFRGEALASIASVAEVELVTKREEDELATRVIVRDGVEVLKEECGAATGTSITVRNLFYSIPARRKFLKSEAYESRLCKSEFLRVAMINEDIAFEYSDGISPLPLILAPQNRHARIVALTRNSYAKKLLPIEANSPLVGIKGYIGTPDTAKSKGRGDQYLFVNGRYFRNNRFFKAICSAYDRLLSGDSAPSYFICISVDEDKIDVNINPTKTEVRFEEEDSVVQILASAVRQTLGRHNIVEVIDFTPSEIDIPSYTPTREYVDAPSFSPTRKYNPFENNDWENDTIPEDFDEMKALSDESFVFSSFDDEPAPQPTTSEVGDLHSDFSVSVTYSALQFSENKYLAVDTVEGLAIVNIARARCRIEYEELLQRQGDGIHSQLLAIGHTVELSAEQKGYVMQNRDKYENYGFKIEDDRGTSVKLMAMPVGFTAEDFTEMVIDGDEISYEERIAKVTTENILLQSPAKLSIEEISSLFDRLMACDEPSYTPSGLKVLDIISDIDNRFKR